MSSNLDIAQCDLPHTQQNDSRDHLVDCRPNKCPGRNCPVVYDRKRRKTSINGSRIRSSYPPVGYGVLRLTTTNVNDQCIRPSYTTVVYGRNVNVSLSSNRNSRIIAFFSFLVSHHQFCSISNGLTVISYATTCSAHTSYPYAVGTPYLS